MHYLIGPVLGIVFGTAVSQVDALRVNTIKKVSVFGILYIQVISQLILAAARAHSANMHSVATAKLGVESRTQAVSRGRELGLFE